MSELKIDCHIDDQKKTVRFLVYDIEYGPFYYPLFKRKIKVLMHAENHTVFKERLVQIEEEVCQNYAYFLLSKKFYSEKKLRDKLASRWFSKESMDKTLTKLLHYGYLDDEKLIQSRSKTYLQKGYGKAQILYKLRSEFGQLDQNKCQVLQESLEQHFDLKPLIEKIKKRSKGKSLEEKNKQYQFLRRKGHSHDISLQILEEVFQKN